MKAPAELSAFWGRMADLDEEIRTCYDEGYDVDVLLQDRLEWQAERNELLEGLGHDSND